jgi:chitodextrinase
MRLLGLVVAATALLVGFAMASTVRSRPAAAWAATCPGPGCNAQHGPGAASKQHRNSLPGRIRDLHQVRSPAVARQITIAWQNPSDLAMTVVRRGPAHACPKTPSQGTGIGGTAIRTRQTDHRVPSPAGYCYSVFALDSAYNFSPPVARSLVPPDLTPPSPPTDIRVSGNAGRVIIRWAPSAGHPSAYVVRRSAQGHCPTRPIHGAPIDAVPATGTSVVDNGASAGTTYCYAVFAVDRSQNVSRPGDSELYLVQPTRSHVVAAAAPASASPASSGAAEIARIVAAVAVGVIVFGLIVLGGILVLGGDRRRTALRYGDRAIPGFPSLSIDRFEARALIIPCALAILALVVVLVGFMSG